MNLKTRTATEPQMLNHYSASSLTESSIELLTDTEPELDSILIQEYQQGLPSDIHCLL